MFPFSFGTDHSCWTNTPRRGKQIPEETGREYVVGLIWNAMREQTLIQLIQKVILGPLKEVLRAAECPERNRQPRMRKDERGEEHETCDFRRILRKKSHGRTKTRNFSSRDSDYQRADRLFLPIQLEEISKEKREEKREKVGDFRPR